MMVKPQGSVFAENDARLLERAEQARAAAIGWLGSHVSADGKPVDAELRNAWWRAPWALSVAGAPALGIRILKWAERHALAPDGALRPGPLEFRAGASPVYELSALAIAAWRFGEYALANRLLDHCALFQAPLTGGVYDDANRRGPFGDEQDLLKTAQLGVAAVVAGRRDIADPIYRWVTELWHLQPYLPNVLLTSRTDAGDLVQITAEDTPARQFLNRVDFTTGHQAYYGPGIAAAFLLDYAAATDTPAAVELAHQYLDLNRQGTSEQFSDLSSVQICKYGWGVACEVRRDPASAYVAEARRMLAWFIDRQHGDGSWGPSSFTLAAPPTATDKLWKTGEHLMELAFLIESLTGVTADAPSRQETAP